MSHGKVYGLLLGLLLIVCVLFAGCSSQSSTTVTTTIPTTQATAKYTAGDVVAMTSSAQTGVWLIMSYDSSADQYERAIIVKNSDGSWGHRETSKTEKFPRAEMDKLYPVKLSHVSVASITPTIATTATTVASMAAPSITSISPTSGATGTTVSLTINGNNFQSGSTVRLIQPGKMPVIATGVSASSNQITCNIALSSLDAGTANVQVTNPDGQATSLPGVFTIGAATPTISSISPTSSDRDKSFTLTVNGQNFNSILSVTLVYSDTYQIQCTNPSTTSSSKLTCTLAIPSSATPGSYSIRVLADGAPSGTKSSAFTVNNSTA
ncbi:MAG: IPT/TIG domain-containing protein [Methanoregula sp.]